MADLQRFLEVLSQGDPVAPADLRQKLGVSQPTVSRLLKQAGSRILRLGRGRATRYATLRRAFGHGRSIPLFMVEEDGVVTRVGTLHALASGQYQLETGDEASAWLLGLNNGSFASLPYYLHDLRPAGFLGRRIARSFAPELGFPADPRRWSDEQIGTYLVRQGEDLPGNLVLGEPAATRANAKVHPSVEDRHRDYPRLARQVLADEVPGSSAAGEQPKFAVHHRQLGHVLVKFSPAAASADAQRWRDLLRAEHLALTQLRALGLPGVETSLHTIEGRVYLESRRFDRVGLRGRLASVSMTMVDAEYAGQGESWRRVADALHDDGLLDSASHRHVRWLQAFGDWIGNSDMHLGNLSLCPSGRGFSLLPAYDMLPMALAPARGELPEVQLRPPVRTDPGDEAWEAAGEAAADYWLALAWDDQLSDGFRRIAGEVGRRWKLLLGQRRAAR